MQRRARLAAALVLAATVAVVVGAALLSGAISLPGTGATNTVGGTILRQACVEVLSVDEAGHAARVRTVAAGDEWLDEHPALGIGQEGTVTFGAYDDLPQPGEKIVVGWLVSVGDELEFPIRAYSTETLDEYLREREGQRMAPGLARLTVRVTQPLLGLVRDDLETQLSSLAEEDAGEATMREEGDALVLELGGNQLGELLTYWNERILDYESRLESAGSVSSVEVSADRTSVEIRASAALLDSPELMGAVTSELPACCGMHQLLVGADAWTVSVRVTDAETGAELLAATLPEGA